MSRRFLEQAAIEFGPLTLFFFVSFVWGFYPGANALVYSTLAALGYSLYRYRRFATFSFTASALILVFGFLTVSLHEPRFLVWEYTLSNLAFGAAALMSNYMRKPFFKKLFSHMFSISDRGWAIITWRWGVVFCLAAVSNQLFWEYHPHEDDWALFRFISTLAMFGFGMLQLRVTKRERLEGSSRWGLKK